MTNLKDGGPAFGGVTSVREKTDFSSLPPNDDGELRIFHGGMPTRQVIETTGGMSLRAWLAGQALAGLCAQRYRFVEFRARMAVKLADALLAALEEKTDE